MHNPGSTDSQCQISQLPLLRPLTTNRQAGSRTPYFHPSCISNFSIQQLPVITILAAAKQEATAGIKQRGSRACSHNTESAATFAKVLTGNVLAASQGQKTPPCSASHLPLQALTDTHGAGKKEADLKSTGNSRFF